MSAVMFGFFTLWMGAALHFGQAAIYTNDWAVKVLGDQRSVDRIAEKHGFTNMGQIGHLKNYYSFRHLGTASRSTVCNKEATAAIAKEPEVEWLQQQVLLRREKRTGGARPLQPDGPGASPGFNQAGWSIPWYNRCVGEARSCAARMRISEAWRRGYAGGGVVVSVLDDGLEREHPDLKPNYDPLASYDVNGQDPDPSPRYSSPAANFHGTQCAGMVAARANGSRCTMGVSFRAWIGGVRMLDGDLTDVVEARALSFRPQHVDIYLAAWGPEDDGATVGGPGPLARVALRNGVQTGRRGRGSVFVWASGSGGRRGDHCSCDGYSSSIYTVSISSSSRSFLERCSSTLAAAHSGEDSEEMVAVGPQQSCMRAWPGTSVSSSLAAGIIALALEANPALTWRDVQHIIVRTSRALLSAPDWQVNGAGHKVSHLYGFGLLDAAAMVKEAEHWRPVPPQHQCVEQTANRPSRIIPPGSGLTSVLEAAGCSGPARVLHLEHVVVRLTVTHGRRGDLSITLTSPSGTVSELLANRPLDNSTEGFQNWDFMTTHCWGELAAGEWTLKIKDTPSPGRENTLPGVLEEWTLVLYGTPRRPHPRHRRGARSAGEEDPDEGYDGPCDPECNEDGCEGPGPQQCVACLHFFVKFKNNSRVCVTDCPRGFWGDRRRCKRCFSSCGSCSGSRSDQCTSCQPGHYLTEGANTCTATCGDGYYPDHDTSTCRACSENCLKCTSYSICTECRADTSLQGNRCLRSCAAGFYRDPEEGLCAPCHKACATCAGAGAEACSRCADGYLAEEWRCVSSCSAGFYATEPSPEMADGHRTCRRCDASCPTCVGPGRGDCSSCSSGHSLQAGACAVNAACTDGQYHDGGGACQACDATCLRCTGPKSQDCISCAPPRGVLDEGRCVEACARGKHHSGGQCHLCDHTCATCVEAGPANCTSCDTDKFGVERYLFQGLCLDSCPEAFYHTGERTCEPCSEHCQLCSGPSHCLRCNSSFYLSGGGCVKLECGEGEVEDPDYDECMACEEGCKKCVLYNPRHCLSCTEGFYNFQDGCYKNCPAKTYSVEQEMTCVPCDDKCVSCDEHECYWCETDLFLSEGECVSECPDGFYGDEDSNECEECHSDCATCDGPEEDACLSCEKGKVLENGGCVSYHEACPVKTFLNDDGACEDCHPSCESCSGEEKNQCTNCAKGRFLTAQQTCVSKCPLGFFSGPVSGRCEACPPGCWLCPDAHSCSRCQSGRRNPLLLQDGRCVQECVRGFPVGQLCHSCAPGCASCERNATHCLACEEPLLLHEHQCVEECPPAHAVREGECRRCPPACRECSPLGQCTGCEEYHFLHEGLCVQTCPDSFYEDVQRGECLFCHPDCALCDGPGARDCDACMDPDAALLNGACLPRCPPAAYRDGPTGECRDCDASCLTCFGPEASSCSSCRGADRLDDQHRCTPASGSCSPRQHAGPDGGCQLCHKSCDRCWGPGKHHCLSCSHGHLLLNGSCVERCPAGHYEDGPDQSCQPCHASCLSCVGQQGHQCLVCKAHLFREAKECVETCQHGHYGNAASRTCERCDPSCGECGGAGEDACLSCAPGLLFLRREGRCLPACPQKHRLDPEHRTCEPCPAGCRTCSGKTSHSCDSCLPGYLLTDGRCESVCGTGQHPVMEGPSGFSCQRCHASCLQCRGPGPLSCTACPARAILEAGRRCLLCCPPGEEEEGEEEEEEGEEREEEEAGPPQQDCCNCTETRGECILSTNLAFRDGGGERGGGERGSLTVFIITCVLLALGLVAVVFLVRHSLSKKTPSDLPPRGYEKLGSGGRFGGGGSSSSSSGRLQETQMVDISRRRRPGNKEDEDDEDDEEDEDIVYMGHDGTVYRKFRYGQLGEDNDNELEYDDESYAFR
ncbi:LOW QUALITY PROTEIN: proprotein convertase subtilisin/kexin type 5-like [Menidia menidia]